MSRFKVINIFDKIFISVCVFLLIYAWINFFTRNLWFSFVFSLILSGAILFLIFYFLEKKRTKTSNSKQRLEEIEKVFLYFRTMRVNDKLSLIKNLISSNYNAQIINNSVMFKNDQCVNQIFIATNERFISEQTLYRIIERRHQSTQNIIIICENSNLNLNVNLVKNLDVKIVDKVAFYDDFIISLNTQLDTSSLNAKTKKTMRQILSNILIPTKAKQYFFCGLILIFSSLILPYKTYYLIFGSLFLMFTILCKLLPVISNRIKSKN